MIKVVLAFAGTAFFFFKVFVYKEVNARGAKVTKGTLECLLGIIEVLLQQSYLFQSFIG